MMRKIIIILFGLTFYKTNADNNIIKPIIIDYDILFYLAIAKIESNYNYNAFNINENANGILQIRPIALRCVNEYYKTKYTIEDCYTYRAFEIMKLYLERWGKDLSYYDKARIWNGGAFGYKKESTKKYANKVINEMQNIHKELIRYYYK